MSNPETVNPEINNPEAKPAKRMLLYADNRAAVESMIAGYEKIYKPVDRPETQWETLYTIAIGTKLLAHGEVDLDQLAATLKSQYQTFDQGLFDKAYTEIKKVAGRDLSSRKQA